MFMEKELAINYLSEPKVRLNSICK